VGNRRETMVLANSVIEQEEYSRFSSLKLVKLVETKGESPDSFEQLSIRDLGVERRIKPKACNTNMWLTLVDHRVRGESTSTRTRSIIVWTPEAGLSGN
jgi:hypothetical protein